MRIHSSSFIVGLVLSIFFFFNSQAQDDTTNADIPTDTEIENPSTHTGTELVSPTPMQTDTSGRYAAHFRLAEEMTERLGQAITTLSEEQKNKILKRIVEFQEEVADVNMEMREEGESTETQEDLDAELVSMVDDIEGMLDEGQKADWIRMKNDWMTEVKAHIHSDRDVMQQDRDNYSK